MSERAASPIVKSASLTSLTSGESRDVTLMRHDADSGPVTIQPKPPMLGVLFEIVDHVEPLSLLISIITLEPAFHFDHLIVPRSPILQVSPPFGCVT